MSEIDKTVFVIPVFGLGAEEMMHRAEIKEQVEAPVFVGTKGNDFYEELTAISEEILKCRLEKLENY